MSEWITVLLVEPGKAPHPEKVGKQLDKIAELLGGQFELGCFSRQHVMLISREDAKNLPVNRVNPATGEIISGPFLLCGFDDIGFASLTSEQR